jgi:hypothetical protein
VSRTFSRDEALWLNNCPIDENAALYVSRWLMIMSIKYKKIKCIIVILESCGPQKI